ncbi:MAG: putative MFS-type transporter [Enhydrobacter sp.]|nr:MAG: putative MFS-type transporter [Enhydrobacter sp.]
MPCVVCRVTRDRHPLTLATLCLAVLVAQLDTAVVNLATRPIGAHFHAGVDALQWVLDSYNLVYAVLLLSGGLLADLYGRRRVFMAGLAIFVAASLVCAAAPDIGVLIAGRAGTGLGAALLVPASLAVIRVAWRDETARGRALGVWAACNGLAMAIGPTLGGLLIHAFGWRSIFLVVIPVGVAALALAPRAIEETADPRGRSFDAPAQVLGAVALGGLALAAIESHGRPVVAAIAAIAALVALVLFLRVERRQGDAALVPLGIFHADAFRGAIAATTAMTFGMYGVLFLLPLSWQGSGALSAIQAGLALMPMALVFVLLSPVSGRLTETVGLRVTTAGGVAVIGLGLLVIALGADRSSIAVDEIGLVLTGLGMGIATGPLMAAAVGAVGHARSGTASALINVARMAGATIGVAVLGAAYALAGGGADGLALAMLAGGAVQLAGAATAWTAMRERRAPRRPAGRAARSGST